MLETHDLLPVSWQLAVPEAVSRRLVDMGTTCNRAALAVEQAHLHQRHFAAEIDAASACAAWAWYRVGFARQWFDCAVSYTEQLTAVYTVAAATFAVYAALIATFHAAGATFPLAEPSVTVPSRVLAEPAECIPLVQMPTGGSKTGQAVKEHNAELATSHRRLLQVAELTVRAHPLDAYDMPSRVASRPALSIDLSADLACCLHAYAANCAWALALTTRPDEEP